MSYGWAAAAQAASDLIGTFGSQWIQAGQNRRQREWIERREDLAYQRGWDTMHYQNWYNSPEQQMSRFQQAGLSPHLMYGKGTPGLTATSSPVSKPGVPKFGLPPLKMPNMLGMYNQTKAIQSMIDLQNEQKILTAQKAANAFVEGQIKGWENVIKMNTARYSGQIAKGEVKLQNQRIANEFQKIAVGQSVEALNKAKKTYTEAQERYAPFQGSWLGITLKNLRDLWDYSQKRGPVVKWKQGGSVE